MSIKTNKKQLNSINAVNLNELTANDLYSSLHELRKCDDFQIIGIAYPSNSIYRDAILFIAGGKLYKLTGASAFCL